MDGQQVEFFSGISCVFIISMFKRQKLKKKWKYDFLKLNDKFLQTQWSEILCSLFFHEKKKIDGHTILI